MSGIFRRLLIFSAVDSLVLQPAPPRNHKPSTEQAIKISYDGNSIGPLLKDRRQEDTAKETLESFGIVGAALIISPLCRNGPLTPSRTTESRVIQLPHLYIPS